MKTLCSYFIPFAVLTLAFSVIFLPNLLWSFFMLIDFFTPWEIRNSDIATQYHQYLINQLPEISEKPVLEINFSEATPEKIIELTNSYTSPLVIRGGIANASAIGKWSDKNFWLDNYGEEEVMCGQINTDKEPQMMTIRKALTDPDPWYIAGEVKTLAKFPDLMKMVHAPHWDGEEHWIDGEYVFPNMFMGYPDMGSDIHNAMGLNIFRMIAGKKKWYLIPSNQAPYIYGMQNEQGFSAITKGFIGHSGMEPSSFINKIERYTVELSPGDVLVNTAWLWHATHNLIEENENELNIGVATRYRVGIHRSLYSNWAQTIMGVYMMAKQKQEKGAFADAIQNGRESEHDKE